MVNPYESPTSDEPPASPTESPPGFWRLSSGFRRGALHGFLWSLPFAFAASAMSQYASNATEAVITAMMYGGSVSLTWSFFAGVVRHSIES